MAGPAVFCVCIMLAGSLGAQEDLEPSESRAPRAWQIAPEVSHYRYKEPGIMTNEGTLYGAVGSYTFRRPVDDGLSPFDSHSETPTAWSTFRIEGRLGFGEVDYDGSYINGMPRSTSGTDDVLVEARLLWGREWQPARLVNGVYAGLGYRYLNDDSSAQPGGYERQSNYLYVPLGSRKDFELADRWDLGLTGEFDVLIVGRQISHLSDADPERPDVRNWQWPGFGAVVSVELRHRDETFDVGVAPFLRYWWVGESDTTKEGYFEPENNTVEYGLSLIVRF